MMYELTHNRFGLISRFNVELLEPDEFKALKVLGLSRNFTFRPESQNDRIPLMDHDALDDVALEQVKGGGYAHGLMAQARQRVAERGLQ
jgi:hypothetical protein